MASTFQSSIFITGRNGALASALLPLLPPHRTHATTSELGSSRAELLLDLLRADQFDYSVLRAGDIVFHLAAASSPDFCRDHPEKSWKINVEGTSYFIDNCLRRGARVFFFSSDTVYGGGDQEKILDEKSTCDPRELYGQMKHSVERRFLERDDFFSLRLSYVISPFDKFTSYLRACVAEAKQAEIIRGFHRTAVALPDVLSLLVSIASAGFIPVKVLNICGPQTLSRLEIAIAFREALFPLLMIREIPSPRGFFESRPRMIKLRSKYLASMLGRSPQKISDYYKGLGETKALK